MNTAREIEEAIVSLPKSELKEFRAWFSKYDSENWDVQIEADVDSGKLSKLGTQALDQHRKKQTKEI